MTDRVDGRLVDPHDSGVLAQVIDEAARVRYQMWFTEMSARLKLLEALLAVWVVECLISQHSLACSVEAAAVVAEECLISLV